MCQQNIVSVNDLQDSVSRILCQQNDLQDSVSRILCQQSDLQYSVSLELCIFIIHGFY